MSAGLQGLVKDWVEYPWRIDHVPRRLDRSTMIHSEAFPGAGRRWQLSLVTRTIDGIELDTLPLYITVIDPTSLVVSASVYASVLVNSGWSSVGVSDKRFMIDINENRMGTVLVDENFLSRSELMKSYVNDDNDSLMIRCRVHVFDNQQMTDIIPQPNNVVPPPGFPLPPGVNQEHDEERRPTNGRKKTRPRDQSTNTTTSRPAKRRRLQ